MANTKEIKNRIKSVKDTQKITNAMYLIASTKMRRAKNELEETRPYFDRLKSAVKRAFKAESNLQSKYFYHGKDRELGGTYGYLIITADKGLAGAYNQNVIKEALAVMGDHTDNRIFVVGDYGRRYFMSKKIAIDENFNFMALQPTLDRAREMSYYMVDLFERDEISKLYVIYTDFKNGLSGGNPAHYELLPFSPGAYDWDDIDGDGESDANEPGFEAETAKMTDAEKASKSKNSVMEFFPNPSVVLDNILPSYLVGFVYSALVDSFCSEQNARMTAMDSANQNAEELLGDLTVKFNHLRQGAITQEITEVSSGARAKKRVQEKHEKQ